MSGLEGEPGRGEQLSLGFIADPNSVHTRRWIEWFARAGHAIHLVDPFAVTIEPGLPPAVAIHRLEPPSSKVPILGLLRRRRRLRAALESIGLDVLHAQFVRRYGWQAGLSGFHPLVVSPWGSDLLQVPRTAVRTRWWNRFALRAADLVTVSSEGMCAASIRAGARPDRIEHIHHGVDTSRFTPGQPDEAVLAQLGPTTDGPRIMSLRAIRPLYRHETVIDAVAMLTGPDSRPRLLMSALGADAAYLATLWARARARGIEEQLVVLDGVPHEQLPGLYRAADVMVSIPETDSFPVTLLEAMATEVPTVVSDVPAVTPVYGPLDPVARELVVPIGDADATAMAIRRALDLGPDERARLGSRLRDFVIASADYDTHMRRMEGLYRRLATAR